MIFRLKGFIKIIFLVYYRSNSSALALPGTGAFAKTYSTNTWYEPSGYPDISDL